MSDIESLQKEADQAVRTLLAAIDIEDLSRHNVGYKRYGEDPFFHFVEMEKKRWKKTCELITSRVRAGGTICDLGCFIPYLPVMLALSGYRVKMVDKYSVLGKKTKDAIFRLGKRYRIEVNDLDILADDFRPLGSNDAVLLMAVVEHLNGSPKRLLEKIKTILSVNGRFFFEVPNIAELGKRIRFMLGDSPLADYENYFDSEYPFMGHNREMTSAEVQYMLKTSGFKIEHIECYDYAAKGPCSIRGRAVSILKQILPFKDRGALILAIART